MQLSNTTHRGLHDLVLHLHVHVLHVALDLCVNGGVMRRYATLKIQGEVIKEESVAQ